MNRSVALILAGGVGSRMNLSIPKQFVVVDGMTVLQHTMLAFQRHQLVSAIYVVASPQWAETVRQQAKEAGIDKFASCLNAGENSFQSAKNGIMALQKEEGENTVVLIHDAVRPLVSQDIISRNIAVCLSRGNAITTLPSQESYMVLDAGENVSSTYILREKLLRAQTPHTFLLGELTTMMQEAEERGITYSQSIFTLANELGHVPLHTAEGEMMNFKLTLPSDFTIFQAILHETRD
ncbi:MAG: 2-C-methyl-D-erythritol 4-phosphate cytidylyltransferase [Bacteroidaceae bacterium]|nr:2-C-methyl-D-erythritol 4-phosphate cytidylyltransferase [Bacteroidaceae bacterium]